MEIVPAHYTSTFFSLGYFIQNQVLPPSQVQSLRESLGELPDRPEVRRKQGVYGVRNLLEISPVVQQLAVLPQVRQFATAILGEGAFAVRATFFDKIPGANWSLFWHQDNAITVKERREVPGFVGWSRKAGVWQVQPPAEVLGKMAAVRIHLDDCDADNGPLRVLPGSHRFGWLDQDLDAWKTRVSEVLCLVKSGGVVVICPLILHASAPARRAEHRRVIHIEYAGHDLPSGLEWNLKVRPSEDHAGGSVGFPNQFFHS